MRWLVVAWSLLRSTAFKSCTGSAYYHWWKVSCAVSTAIMKRSERGSWGLCELAGGSSQCSCCRVPPWESRVHKRSQVRRCHFFGPRLEGLPASLGLGLRHVSGAKGKTKCLFFTASCDILRQGRIGAQSQFALAVARGVRLRNGRDPTTFLYKLVRGGETGRRAEGGGRSQCNFENSTCPSAG